MPKIKLQITRNLVQLVELERPTVLGRGKEADIVLLDQLVSRVHVKLTPGDGGAVILEDLGSANGTFVNSVKVHSQLLEEGDLVEIGKTQFVFSTEKETKPGRAVDLTGAQKLADFGEEGLIAERDVEFKFFSTEDIGLKLCALSTKMLRAQSPVKDPAVGQVEIALQEAIGNAIRHGHKYEASKIVHYRWHVHEDRVVYKVEDTGPGFDYRAAIQRGLELDAASAARQRHAEGGLGGLGILMMLRCVDRVEYNQSGNECTLTKFFGPPPDQRGRRSDRFPAVTPEAMSLEDTNLGGTSSSKE